jgi:peptidoglycan/LPS O-acetylase OafA/YrhL
VPSTSVPTQTEKHPLASKTGAGSALVSSVLDPLDSLVLKGAAILAIALHNYYHIVLSFDYNEFDFSAKRVFGFLAAMANPRLAFQAFFAYLGHFGVQVFIFLSAYGLALKYWDNAESHGAFLWGRVKKLYPAFLLAISFWVIVGGFAKGLLGPLQRMEQNWQALLYQVLGIADFVPGRALDPVGPWWFMPFIMQFYLIWPLVRGAVKRFGAQALIVLGFTSAVLIYGINPWLVSHWNINLMFCPIGHMPEICLGVAAARYGFFPGRLWMGLSVAIFALSNVYYGLWFLSYGSALLIMLWSYRQVRTFLRSRIFVYLGRRSMEIFLVNGFTRRPFIIAARRFPALILGLLSVPVAALVGELIAQIIGRSKRVRPGSAVSEASINPQAQ